MFSLTGRTALVTGAANGIGQAIAMRLAQAGCAVAVTDKADVPLDTTIALCEPFGTKVIGETMDVRDVNHIKAAVASIGSRLGRVDILVNNAGINRPTPAVEVSIENWEDHFNTIVRGGFFCAQAVAPAMMEQHFGRIIFISSQSGLIGIPGQAVYCAAKGALVNMVRSRSIRSPRHSSRPI